MELAHVSSWWPHHPHRADPHKHIQLTPPGLALHCHMTVSHSDHVTVGALGLYADEAYLFQVRISPFVGGPLYCCETKHTAFGTLFCVKKGQSQRAGCLSSKFVFPEHWKVDESGHPYCWSSAEPLEGLFVSSLVTALLSDIFSSSFFSLGQIFSKNKRKKKETILREVLPYQCVQK